VRNNTRRAVPEPARKRLLGITKTHRFLRVCDEDETSGDGSRRNVDVQAGDSGAAGIRDRRPLHVALTVDGVSSEVASFRRCLFRSSKSDTVRSLYHWLLDHPGRRSYCLCIAVTVEANRQRDSGPMSPTIQDERASTSVTVSNFEVWHCQQRVL
jgi:hypothetical protein